MTTLALNQLQPELRTHQRLGVNLLAYYLSSKAIHQYLESGLVRNQTKTSQPRTMSRLQPGSLALQSRPAGVITHGISTTPSGGTVTGATATVPMAMTDRHPTANGAGAATASVSRPGAGDAFHPAEVRFTALLHYLGV